MQSILNRQTLSAAAITAALTSTPVLADDIDIYTSQISSQQRPNLLFVLDYSSSMRDPIVAGGLPKIDILKNAMVTVLNDNFNRLNVGLGPMYASQTAGIKWPISPLDGDASDVDPAIPAGAFTSRDIILNRILSTNEGGGTATVDALVEAGQYFTGSEVTHGDNDANFVLRHEPNAWNSLNNRFTGGDHRSSHPVTYTPSNSFQASSLQPDFYSICVIKGVDETNPENTDGDQDFDLTGTDPSSSCFINSRAYYDCEHLTSNDNQVYESGDRPGEISHLRCRYPRNEAWTTPNYISPVASQCQANAIVLISDGQPTARTEGSSLDVAAGMPSTNCEDLGPTIFAGVGNAQVAGNCGPEVVERLASNPANPSIPESTVRTFTVGFDIEDAGREYLERLAAEGNGSFFDASQPGELTAAIDEIIVEVMSGTETFVELALDTNQANFSHDSRTYFSLFEPSANQSWRGNLKGYYLNSSGLRDLNNLDATTQSADDGVVRFAATAQSFWSELPDGNEVTAGGANEQLVGATRNIYTYTGTSVPSFGVDLASSDDYKLESGNALVTDTLLGLPNGSPLRDTYADWIHTEPMGAPLHSRAVAIDYPNDKRVVYIMTNQGLLHAIDASKPNATDPDDATGGEELFAFMPRRLLSNVSRMIANDPAGGHIYGLDGQITPWHDDTNNDGIVNNGEEVLLVFGMRRGGDSYYAMDVTDPARPELKWEINGSQADFANLGETWSRMSLISVNRNGTNTDVLAFGGGYDAATLDPETSRVASKGNAIYMVDRDGSLVWHVDDTDDSDLIYAIPSDLSIIDTDQDGNADRIYVGDFGGQVWRVDFDDISTTPSVTRFADLDDGDHQPFFYPPSVAFNQATPSNFLSVTLGSGNRTNPLLTGQVNNFYMLRDLDTDKGGPDGTFTTIRNNTLYDATNNNIGSTDTNQVTVARQALAAADGWKIALDPGEKSLSSVVTFEGKVLATTFQEDPNISADPCSFSSLGNLYIVDLETAEPVRFFDDGSRNFGTLAADDRKTPLNTSSIPSSPQIVFPEKDPTGPNGDGGKIQVVVGVETVDVINQSLVRVYWHAK